MNRITFGRLAAIAAFAVIGAQAMSVTIYGLSTGNQIVSFDSSMPGTLTSAHFINGLQNSESVIGIDFSPANGQLYAVGSSSTLYTINTTTGFATSVGSLGVVLNGTNFGMDFNPVLNRIRLVSDLEQNLVINPLNGSATVATNLFYNAADPNFGKDPNVVASAYTNNFSNAASTQLFGIDSQLDILVTQANSAGTLGTVGPLGFNTNGNTGLDVGQNGIAYASFTGPTAGFSSLFIVNLNTGFSSSVGTIGVGDGTLILRDIAVVAVPEPATIAALFVGVAALARRRRK